MTRADFEPYTVEELTEQFPFALFEMTSDALRLPDRAMAASTGVRDSD